MIKTFRDKDTEALYNDVLVRRFKDFERPARRKLYYLQFGESALAGLTEMLMTSRLWIIIEGAKKHDYSS